MPSPAAQGLLELLEVMRRLRDPETGCPWDREQDFRSIAPYTLEEAFEVADAIERDDRDALRDELGDLLFQVVFHAHLAQERGWFGFDAVASGIARKLVRRHPHVFGPASGAAAAPDAPSWEDLKALERGAAGADGALAGVARALPALSRAAKLGRRAARVKFDWPAAPPVRDKVLEELAEVDAAIAAGSVPERVGEELGDLLFAIANWARHLGHDPEVALRGANAKFERRFGCMERIASERGQALAGLTPDEWNDLWLEAKARERGISA
jgi:nucleoside triphosphate diphosphatase